MYQDFDNGLARERVAQMREEVVSNRLGAREGDRVALRSRVARRAALLTALFR